MISETLRPLAMTLGRLHADDRNVRVHDERNLAAIAASLRRFGQQAPAVFAVRGRRRVVIKGNGLLAAARSLGWTHLAAVESGLAAEEATAFAIADNRTSDLSSFDAELLAAQLQELEEAEFDIEAAGFTDEELQGLLDDLEGGGEAPPAAAEGEGRARGERVALILVGHLRFEVARAAFERWLGGLEGKVGADPDRLVSEIKRRLKL